MLTLRNLGEAALVFAVDHFDGPFSCVNQLVLRPSVVNAVKKGVFHIYTVAHVNDAVKLLTTMDWDADDGRDTIRQRIVDHLYEVANGKEEIPWWKFWQKNED